MKQQKKLPLHIIPMTEEFVLGYCNAYDSVAREKRYLYLTQAPPVDETRRLINLNIKNEIPYFVAIEKSSNIVIGWCGLILNDIEGFTHSAELHMGVVKGYRNMGIGTGLIHNMLGKAKSRELERVELEVYASNKEAILLYEKFGFKVEGIKKNARKFDDYYDDIICMAIFLTSQ